MNEFIPSPWCTSRPLITIPRGVLSAVDASQADFGNCSSPYCDGAFSPKMMLLSSCALPVHKNRGRF